MLNIAESGERYRVSFLVIPEMGGMVAPFRPKSSRVYEERSGTECACTSLPCASERRHFQRRGKTTFGSCSQRARTHSSLPRRKLSVPIALGQHTRQRKRE